MSEMRHPLAWYDNIPVFGWLMLRGKCRYCRAPIAMRYPIVEFMAAALFVLYYIMFFIEQRGPCPPEPTFARNLSIQQDWPIYMLYMLTVAALLAVEPDRRGAVHHPDRNAVADGRRGRARAHDHRPAKPAGGTLNIAGPPSALAAGAAAGLLISIVLLRRGLIPLSFEHDAPRWSTSASSMSENWRRARADNRQPPPPPKEMTRGQIRAEIRKEMYFLMPPMILGAMWVIACWKIAPIGRLWVSLTRYDWFTGLCGALLGALVGGFIVWITRILGTLGFGREAMGMGDVHLMFGVGAVIGAGASTVAFFIAPFFGIAIAVYMLFAGKRRELPYGPYLSLGAAFAMIFYCPIADALRPGLSAIVILLRQTLTGA